MTATSSNVEPSSEAPETEASAESSDGASFPDWLREVAHVAARTPGTHVQVLTGRTLCAGRFAVEQLLGRGGMGQVYVALDLKTRTRVALKTLQSVTPAGIYRLKREFRALCNVQHENLVRMHQLFEDSGTWFFTMDWVSGIPLDEYLQQHPDVASIRSCFGQLVAGVAAIHASGKVHRDLKPSNVLIGEGGQLTILDFGLVASLGASADSGAALDTFESAIVGTPAYMAPEQFYGNHTAASDWYSVGLMLFQALASERPFTRALDPAMGRQCDGPAPSTHNPLVPTELDGLCVELLRLDPTRRPTHERLRTVLATPRSATVASHASAAPGALLGREGEIDQLRGALDAVSRGDTKVILLTGPSGIGKSSLLHHFVAHARKLGALVFEGSCFENESVPYKGIEAIVDEIARYLRTVSPEEVTALVPPGVAALTRIFPTLGRVEVLGQFAAAHPDTVQSGGMHSDAADAQSRRELAFGCLRQLLTQLARSTPVVLALDDAHWADADTAVLLNYVLAPPLPARCMFVATGRRGATETTAFLPRFIRTCEQNRISWTEIALPPLTHSVATRLARSLLPDISRAALVVEEARGQPYLLYEYSRFLADTDSAADQVDLAHVILERVRTLPPDGRTLLLLAAVAAVPLTRTTALIALEDNRRDDNACDHNPRDAHWYRATVVALCTRRLLHEVRNSADDGVTCHHDRVRAVLLGSIDAGELASLHARLARGLLAADTLDYEALAYHHAGAGSFVEAAECAERAADAALDTLAFHRAAEWYGDALTWRARLTSGHDGELRSKRARALAKAGHGAAAAAAFLEVAASERDQARAFTLRTRAAEQYLFTGHYAQGNALLRQLLGEVGHRLPRSRLGWLSSYAVESLRLRRDLRRAASAAEQPVQVSDHSRIPAQLTVFRAAASTCGVLDVVQGAVFAKQHLRIALRAGDAEHVLYGLAAEIAAAASKGPSARRRVWELLELGRVWTARAPDSAAAAYFTAATGAARVLLGEFRAGALLAERAETYLRTRCSGVTWELNVARTFMAISWVATGDLTRVSECVPRWVRDATERADLYAATHLRLTLPPALLAQGDVEAASAAIDEAESTWQAGGLNQATLNIWDARTVVALYRHDDAAQLLEAYTRYQQFFSSPLAYIQANRVFSHYFAGCCQLALFDLGALGRAATGVAAKHARALLRDAAPYARGYGALLQAAVELARGNRVASCAALDHAIIQLAGADIALQAAAARWRLGELMAGEEGRAHCEAALGALRASGVVNPEQYARALAPGFDRA